MSYETPKLWPCGNYKPSSDPFARHKQKYYTQNYANLNQFHVLAFDQKISSDKIFIGSTHFGSTSQSTKTSPLLPSHLGIWAIPRNDSL